MTRGTRTTTNATAAVSRRQVIRSCQRRGWTLQPSALDGILQRLADSRGDTLPELLDHVADAMKMSGAGGGRTVTGDVWRRVLDDLEEEEEEGGVTRKARETTAQLELVSAFHMPRLVYHRESGGRFVVEEANWSLWGTAEDRIGVLARRYALLQQRVLRHELFRPDDLRLSGGVGRHRLTPIESLLGSGGGGGQQPRLVLVLGVLLQLQQEGMYCLEDPTGQVPVDLSSAYVTDGSFITEHSILLVEGHFQDGLLFVHRLGQPLQETRDDALAAIRKQVSHPYFTDPYSRGESSFDVPQQSLLLLSDVQADHPLVVLQLEALLARYEALAASDNDNMPAFVLMGPFSSHPSPRRQTQGLDELVNLIARNFPRLAATAHFCFVPSSDAVGVLPLAPPKLPGIAASRLRHCHLASNPCRIRHGDAAGGGARCETVIFRYDLLPALQQRGVALPGGGGEEEEDDEGVSPRQRPYSRLLKTVLDQGHLAPVAGTPVYWNYDHALSLYPLPDCLVLAGGGGDVCHTEQYWGCRAIVPGSMLSASSSSPSPQRGLGQQQPCTYVVYRPGGGESDDDSALEVDEPDEVEFCSLDIKEELKKKEEEAKKKGGKEKKKGGKEKKKG